MPVVVVDNVTITVTDARKGILLHLLEGPDRLISMATNTRRAMLDSGLIESFEATRRSHSGHRMRHYRLTESGRRVALALKSRDSGRPH